METIEDTPFSRFLVKISNSYYQTLGKFTKSLLIGNKNDEHEGNFKMGNEPPSKRKFTAKYKKNNVKLHSMKNRKGLKKGKG